MSESEYRERYRRTLVRHLVERLVFEHTCASKDAAARAFYAVFVSETMIERGFQRLREDVDALRPLPAAVLLIQRRAGFRGHPLFRTDGLLIPEAIKLLQDVRHGCLTGRVKREADSRHRSLRPVADMVPMIMDAVVEMVERGAISPDRFRQFCAEPSIDLAFRALFDPKDAEVLASIFAKRQRAFLDDRGSLSVTAHALFEEVRFRFLTSMDERITRLFVDRAPSADAQVKHAA